MQKQRGSVTVIAIVMLLFLMVVAIAWLPMMTIEKTAASSDYREQQAWYAAEAGYKKAAAVTALYIVFRCQPRPVAVFII